MQSPWNSWRKSKEPTVAGPIRELALRRCKNSHFYLLFAQALALDGFDGGNPEEMHFFELLMRYLLGEVLNFFESQSRRSHQELRADPFHPLTPKPFIVVM
jgi:hypothetical protein